jgi:hypothetical protein
MPPSPRYTVRLPHALDAQIQARVQAGTPFAVLIREALSAYLADTPPTETPTAADSADTLRKIQEHLVALTARVAILELALTTAPTPRRHVADRDADTLPTDADSAPPGADTPAPPRRPGRPSGPLRQRILTLLQTHPEGLSAEELRVYLKVDKPIGDVLQGMRKGGVVTTRGRRPDLRYVVGEGSN